MDYERLVRRIRSSPKLFAEDTRKIDRILMEAKRRMLTRRRKREFAVGPYSGLTRSELRASRTCEPDWY